MRSRMPSTVAVWMLLGVTAPTALAAVQPIRSITLQNSEGGSTFTIQNPVGPVTAQYGSGSLLATSAATADFGILRAYSQTSAEGTNLLMTGRVFSTQFVDGFIISSPGLNGTEGHMTATIHYGWSPSWAVDAPTSPGALSFQNLEASMGIAISSNGSLNSLGVTQQIDRRCQFPGLCNTNDFGFTESPFGFIEVVDSVPGESVTVRVPFVFGAENILIGSLATRSISGSGQGGAASGSMDAYGSYYWGGIQDVVGPSGLSVAYGFGSASGTDYRLSFVPVIPEASTAWMLLAGLIAMTGARRRTRDRGPECRRRS